jgi:M6 family metalloprotease-like protein
MKGAACPIWPAQGWECNQGCKRKKGEGIMRYFKFLSAVLALIFNIANASDPGDSYIYGDSVEDGATIQVPVVKVTEGIATSTSADQSTNNILQSDAAVLKGQPFIPSSSFKVTDEKNKNPNRPWATILCRYLGDTAPHPKDHYAQLMGIPDAEYPSIIHYMRETSYKQVRMDGSVVAGWYELANPEIYYNQDNDAFPDFTPLANDCASAAAADIDFEDFDGLNLMFSGATGCCAWGISSWSVTVNGQTYNVRMTWMPGNTHDLGFLSHEMGHGFGEPHSDCGVWEKGGACNVRDPQFGCTPVHTLAAYKDRFAGWLQDDQKITLVKNSGSHNVYLDRLGKPKGKDSRALVLAEVQLENQPGIYYTVESRRFSGYDHHIPFESVVIQKLDLNSGDPAKIVLPPGETCATGGWKPGQVFTDSVNGVTIEVLSESKVGHNVQITY